MRVFAVLIALLSCTVTPPSTVLAYFDTDYAINAHDLTLQELVKFTGFGLNCDEDDETCIEKSEKDFTTWLLLADSEMYDMATMSEIQSDIKDARQDLFVCSENAKTSVSVRAKLARTGKIRGVNLGGWLVLEPWIVPSMFYQFLGETDPDKIAMDPYSFCKVLGPEEGNKQMRRHWKTFLTEGDIKELKKAGVNAFRLPVGDWMFVPYGPYIGCTDGALDQLDWLLEMATKYDIPVMIDVHTMKGGQNGLDNSGVVQDLIWVPPTEENPAQFVHWDTRAAHWMGQYDRWLQHYVSFNFDNFKHSLKVISNIAEWYHANPIIMALEGVNEPWEHTPPNALGLFNWLSYNIVQKGPAKDWWWVMHDSFRATHPLWKDLLVGCDNLIIDTHVYMAWNGVGKPDDYVKQACVYQPLAAARQDFVPLFVGEWSLATDNCAMWLNGFQDNLGNYPQLPCKRVTCPDPYMGPEQPNSPPDSSVEHWLPIGTGNSTVIHGTCPVEGDTFGGDTYEENIFVSTLNTALLAAYHDIASGFFFWNFKTELPEPRWNFLEAWRRGWFPKHLSQLDKYGDDGLFGMVCDLYPKPDISGMFQPAGIRHKPAEDAPEPAPAPAAEEGTGAPHELGGGGVTAAATEATATVPPTLSSDVDININHQEATAHMQKPLRTSDSTSHTTGALPSYTTTSTTPVIAAETTTSKSDEVAEAAAGCDKPTSSDADTEASKTAGNDGDEDGDEDEDEGGPFSYLWPGDDVVRGGIIGVVIIASVSFICGILSLCVWQSCCGKQSGSYDRL